MFFSDIYVDDNEKIDKLPVPTRNGYDFLGWFLDSELQNEFDENTKVNSNLNLYAKWEKSEFTIIFNSNGGSTVAAITQNYGTTVSAPATPTKNGYTFGGWYSDAGLTQPYVFSTMPAQNVSLFSKWNTIIYSIVFNENGGGAFAVDVFQKSYTIESSRIVLPNSIKTGYMFDGWYTNSDFSGQRIYEIPTNSIGNIVFYAKWISEFDALYNYMKKMEQ